MKAFDTLPEGYCEILNLNLQKDKKTALLVNGLALLIMAAMLIPVLFLVPVGPLFDLSDPVLYFLRWGVLLAGAAAYIILHEWTHGFAMGRYGKSRVQYGFTGLYAYAGSADYFPKRAYIVIALAPLVLWGVILLVFLPLVPADWFWIVYGLQIANIGGAAGDLYVVWRFRKFPGDILVRDDGVSMTVFAKEAGIPETAGGR
ncbi:MAG TPA: DUF3267 domain-containing protein [Candidatus Merdivicinus intestinavium]|nr:DUF3267 domain-containing protein [Candidatus Merdivicinus intestinavium]